MANYSNLKAAIAAAIKTNGNQEITGQVLQDVLTSIVSVIGANYTFAGVATPSTNPGTPDQNVAYLASQAGTYSNFNAVVLPAGIHLLLWNGAWSTQTFFAIDDEPIANSNNLVKSKGIFKSQLVERDITNFAKLGKWSCNNSSYAELTLDDTGYNGTFYLKKSSTPSARLYLNCTKLTNNTLYRISFDFDTSDDKQLSTVGKGINIDSAWANLYDIYGRNAIATSIGNIDFTFKKDETFNYIIVAYNGSNLTFPMTATISNFRIAEVKQNAEQTEINRIDIAELKRTSVYTCYDRVENVTDLMHTWETNAPDVWDYQVSDTEIVLTNKVKKTSSYCGFYIGDIPNGTLLELKLHVEGPLTSIGYFNDLAYQSWNPLLDKKTNTSRGTNTNGNLTVVFEKTSTGNWIVFSSNSYDTEDVIKISNYSLWTVVQNKDLTDRVIRLENRYKYPVITTIVPPNYTWEKYMDLQGTFTTGSGQGSCVYDDIFVNASTSNSNGELQIKMYDLVSKQLLQSMLLTDITNVRTHANTISFGRKYDESDPLPLLYIPSGYVLEGTTDGQVYVYRFTGTIGNLSATLIQTITLKDVGPWTEWICDAENNRAWILNKGYICYNIPSPQAGDIDIDDSTPKIDEFSLPSMTYPAGVTKSSNQGFMYNKGRIWLASGVPSFVGEGADACFISAINVRSKCREMVVWLSDVGLTNGTSNVYEPEGIFIWNNELYIPYHGFIAKINKIDLV